MQSLAFSTEVRKRLRHARNELASDAASGGWCLSFEENSATPLSSRSTLAAPALTMAQNKLHLHKTSLFDFLSVTSSDEDGCTDSEGGDAKDFGSCNSSSNRTAPSLSMDSLTDLLSSKCPSFCLEIEAMEQENMSDDMSMLLDSLDEHTGKFVALTISDKDALSASITPSSSPLPSLLIPGSVF